MTDFQIYKKLRPFILKRICYALLGLVFMVLMIGVTSYTGHMYPDYWSEIVIVYMGISMIIGWKIIKKGANLYSMAQVALITRIVTGEEYTGDYIKDARQRVNSTFKYASAGGLIKNIIRHKNFRKVSQFVTVMAANLVPYVGPCSMAWIFAHRDEKKLNGACHAITNYVNHRWTMRKKIFIAVIKEIILVTVLTIVILSLEFLIYLELGNFVSDVDALMDKMGDVFTTMEITWNLFFESKGIHWAVLDVMVVVALYIAWFIKVYSIRSFEMIGIIREFLKYGEENPPSDDLYIKLTAGWEKVNGHTEDRKAEELDRQEQ